MSEQTELFNSKQIKKRHYHKRISSDGQEWRCCRCQRYMPISKFSINKKTGMPYSFCKKCDCAMHHEYYMKHREEILRKDKIYRDSRLEYERNRMLKFKTNGGGTWIKVMCDCGCGIEFWVQRCNAKGRRYFDKEHMKGHMKGPKATRWYGGRYVNKRNYVIINARNNPEIPDWLKIMCSKSGFIAEHRLIVARAIGRPLKKEETVHHIDGNKGNNTEGNLALFASASAHIRWVRHDGGPGPIWQGEEELDSIFVVD